MDNHEHWIGLKKDSGTGLWTWQESQLEANFTLWLNNVNYPCVTMNAQLAGIYDHVLREPALEKLYAKYRSLS